MVTVSKAVPSQDWGTLHTPKLKHALSAAFPDHAELRPMLTASAATSN